VEKLFDLYFKI